MHSPLRKAARHGRTLNSTGNGLAADGNRDGVVDEQDYVMWRENFGATREEAVVQVPTHAVPEPRFIGALVACGLLFSRVLKRSRNRPYADSDR